MNRILGYQPLVLTALALGCALALGASMTPRENNPAVSPEFEAAPLVPLASEPPARLVVDAPLPEQLALGRVVVRYRAEHLRILPVYGAAALDVSPRIGHLHVTVDDGPWRWVDASGQPLIINKLPAGPHKLLLELVDPTHRVIDSATVRVVIPQLAPPQH